MEQEKELGALLNLRFGYGTMEELKDMRRKIRKQREETVYKQMQRRKALLDGVAIAFLLLVLVVFVGGMFIFIGKAKGLF